MHIKNNNDVYQFVERLKMECKKNQANELFEQLDAALSLGSSGLEILGAIRQTIIDNRSRVVELLGRGSNEEADQIIAFVDKAFGR